MFDDVHWIHKVAIQPKFKSLNPKSTLSAIYGMLHIRAQD